VQLCGCTRVHPAEPATADCTFEDVNQALHGRTVRVQLASGDDFYAENVRVTPSATTLTVLFHGDPMKWPPPSPARRDTTLETSAIRRLTVPGTHGGSNAGRGLRYGLLIGAAVGALVGAAAYQPGTGDPSREALAVTMGVIGSLACGVVGFALGSIAGTDEVYDFVGTGPGAPVRPQRHGGA